MISNGEVIMENSKWLSFEEAIKYLNVGKTNLYALAQEGHIPARKVGKKWVFDKDLLDSWLKANQPIESFFLNFDADIEQNEALREPQREGYLRAYEFFSAGKNKAILQIPVGCGKTGLAALLPLGMAKGRVIVIAPNLTIKKGLYDAMDITNRQKCFWRKGKVLSNEQMLAGPFASTLDTGNLSVLDKSHIVITNVQQLATNTDKWLNAFPDDFFDMIIIDEAHHSAANSWKKVIERFPNAKVVMMTATPFRSDRQELDGELIYRFPFRSATLKGYIKRLIASYVAPSEITLDFRDQKNKTYTLDDVLKLKEEEWFSRGIALSPLCNEHIVDNSLERLESLRLSGTRHQLIAVACSISHAREIRSLYEKRGYTTEVIHSQQNEDEQEQILLSLKNGTLDCIIQVQMLGEGFDHPKLSIAAIFRPFRSLAPYIQFVGRIMRVIVQNDSTHPDNVGHIVTHLGMNLDQRLKEFKQFENDDQNFWEKIISGEEPEVPITVADGSTRLRVSEKMIVHNEIIDSLWEEDFSTLEDQHIITELRERLELLGLDPDLAEELVKNKKESEIMRKKASAEPFLIQPQIEWKENRRRLDEEVKRAAKILLNNLGLNMAGKELIYKYRLGLGVTSNYACAVMMLNQEIKKRLAKERSAVTNEEFKKIRGDLDDILKDCIRRIQKAKDSVESDET